MKPIKTLSLSAFLSQTSFGVSAAVGDVITDSKKLKYNVLSEPSDGTFDRPVDDYDINGRLIMRHADEDLLPNLRHGICIFRQGSVSRKILVK